jgi:hypothetical protein
MFALVQNGIIQFLIQPGIPFSWNGVEYPGNWIQLASPEERASIGICDVVYGEQPSDQYYWITQLPPVYNAQTNQVDILFTSTPKDLTQIKANAFNQVNQTAYTILFPTDWMVVKSVETSTPINPDWNSWRASIRVTADQTRTAVTGAVDVAAVQNIMSNIVWAKSPSQVALEAEQAAKEAEALKLNEGALNGN